jgi:hypothetical protein
MPQEDADTSEMDEAEEVLGMALPSRDVSLLTGMTHVFSRA